MNAGPFLHPEWKRALAEIVALDPKPGDSTFGLYIGLGQSF